MDKEALDYRNMLTALEPKAQAAYDKLVVWLSAGAMGLSFTVLDSIVVGDGAARGLGALGWAWVMWVISLTLALMSHLVSTYALRTAIEQVDAGTSSLPPLGGGFDVVLQFLHPSAAVAFVAGTACAGRFLYLNL